MARWRHSRLIYCTSATSISRVHFLEALCAWRTSMQAHLGAEGEVGQGPRGGGECRIPPGQTEWLPRKYFLGCTQGLKTLFTQGIKGVEGQLLTSQSADHSHRTESLSRHYGCLAWLGPQQTCEILPESDTFPQGLTERVQC